MQRLSRLLATITLLIILLPTRILHAHEISPSVSDLVINGDSVSLEIRLNLESFVARIDLQSLSDTDDTEVANDYDQFRAMTPENLESAFRQFWPEMAKRFSINAPQQLALTLDYVQIPEAGNVDLPRQSTIGVSANQQGYTAGVTVTWPADYGALVIRQQGVEEPYTGYLENGGVSDLIFATGGNEKTAWQTFLAYIPVGFDHIIPKGLDHILFVLGLFFLAVRLKPLIWQISVFTIAHTVTLVLGALGWISIPAAIVEPLIAASIVYVAIENVFTDTLRPSRTLVIFCFGLLHGLGFASVLAEFGLPGKGFIAALLGFNVGVEAGQLAVVAIAFVTTALWFRNHPGYRRWIAVPASVVIGLTGAWWFVQRVFFA